MDSIRDLKNEPEFQASSPMSTASIDHIDDHLNNASRVESQQPEQQHHKQVKFSERVSNSVSSVKSTISFYSDSDDDSKTASKKLKDYLTDPDEHKKPLLTSFKDTKKLKSSILKSKRANYSSINNSDYIMEENRLRSGSLDSINNKLNTSTSSVRFDNEFINQNLFINSNTFLEDLAKSNEHDEFLSTRYEVNQIKKEETYKKSNIINQSKSNFFFQKRAWTTTKFTT